MKGFSVGISPAILPANLQISVETLLPESRVGGSLFNDCPEQTLSNFVLNTPIGGSFPPAYSFLPRTPLFLLARIILEPVLNTDLEPDTRRDLCGNRAIAKCHNRKARRLGSIPPTSDLADNLKYPKYLKIVNDSAPRRISSSSDRERG